MTPGRRRRRVSRCWLPALAVGLVVAALGLPAGAVETPVGSKNFTAPPYVPNYFNNETGAFTGGRSAAAPAYMAPRAYPRSFYSGTVATHRFVRGRVVSRSRYRHSTHGRVIAHRRLVHVAPRGGRRPTLHTRPSAVHHTLVRPPARSAAGAKRVARAGR
jgi:hypothetical protein